MSLLTTQRNQVIAAAAATIGAFGLGTALAWSSPAIPDIEEKFNDNNTGNNPKFGELSKEDESWIGAYLCLGALISGPVAGISINYIGRKTTMLLLSAPFVLGWLLIAYAQTKAMLFLGRVITGFSGGAFSLASPVFIGEIAEDSIRGTLGSGFQLMVVIGIAFTYGVGWPLSWQWLSVVCGVVPLIFLVAMIFVPESPRYLLMKGRHAEATNSLMWYRRAASSSEVEDELKATEDSVNDAKANAATFKDLLEPHILKPTLILLALMFFQQLSGINAVIFYSVDIFKSAGSDMNDNLSTLIIGLVQIAATVGAVIFVDRAGRKILLITSDILMAVSLVALGIYFQIKSNSEENASTITWIPLISLMVFIVAFSIGYGPIPWMMVGEILPANAKGLSASLATAFNWFLAFLVTKFFGNIQDAVGIHWCYWAFAIVCVAGAAFVLLLVPETKGKSFDEIQAAFGAPPPRTQMSPNRNAHVDYDYEDGDASKND